LTAVHKRVVKRQWTKRWSVVSKHFLPRGARAAIWPPYLHQPVGRPNPILICKPSEKFDLRRGPSLPNHLVQGGCSGAVELHLISQLGGVVAIYRELPRDFIARLGVKMDGTKSRPNIHKLQEMV
jgi:hypothetical protein